MRVFEDLQGSAGTELAGCAEKTLDVTTDERRDSISHFHPDVRIPPPHDSRRGYEVGIERHRLAPASTHWAFKHEALTGYRLRWKSPLGIHACPLHLAQCHFVSTRSVVGTPYSVERPVTGILSGANQQRQGLSSISLTHSKTSTLIIIDSLEHRYGWSGTVVDGARYARRGLPVHCSNVPCMYSTVHTLITCHFVSGFKRAKS